MKIKTKSGFQTELNEAVLDDMEFVDALADLESGNGLAMSRVCVQLLGEEGRKALYQHLRNESGRVPASNVEAELIEILKAAGNPGKN